MLIGIDASRAFLKERTGIEEYSYQVIKHLRDKLNGHQVILYVRISSGKSAKAETALGSDCQLPNNWKIKIIKFPYFWTQIGLSLEMMLHPVDVLFVPSHVVPVIHPVRTVVTIHGLEYEVLPEAYSAWERLYMRLSIRFSCRSASRIIAVSENTKKDLMKLYGVPNEKIEMVHEGVGENTQNLLTNNQSISNDKIFEYKPYLLFIGRLEKRKNIEGIIEAYKILKEKYKIPHSLILVGGQGHGFNIIKLEIENSLKIATTLAGSRYDGKNCKLKIINLGYVDEATKWQLLSQADVFLFPTFYEGFGLPVLEAQSVGTPVVISNTSALPEVAGAAAAYCDPTEPVSIANAIYSITSNPAQKKDLIEEGLENVKRFSWEKCAIEIARVIL